MSRTICWRRKRGFSPLAPVFAATALVLIFSFGMPVTATPPKISYIQRWSVDGTNGVLLHFDTDANRRYILQATDKFGTNAIWTNLYSAPNLPFNDHYIVPDLRPGNHFYRLQVTR
jgi:hypothetical protein